MVMLDGRGVDQHRIHGKNIELIDKFLTTDIFHEKYSDTGISYRELFLDRYSALNSSLKNEIPETKINPNGILLRAWIQNDGVHMMTEKGIPIYLIFSRCVAEVFGELIKNPELFNDFFLELINNLTHKRKEISINNFLGFIALLNSYGESTENTLCNLFTHARLNGYTINSNINFDDEYEIHIEHRKNLNSAHLVIKNDYNFLNINGNEMRKIEKQKNLSFISTFINDSGNNSIRSIQLKIIDKINSILPNSYLVMI